MLLLLPLVIVIVHAQYPLRDSRATAGHVLLGQNPCVSKQTCSECLQTPSCAWCSQPQYSASDGSPLPRCNQEEFYHMSSRYIVFGLTYDRYDTIHVTQSTHTHYYCYSISQT